MNTLESVQRFFPEVTSVRDAKEAIQIEVIPKDEERSKKLSHKECALALACKREFKADGVILSRSKAYIITGRTAVRFDVPPSVAREIVAFDRGAHFMPGTYQLSKPTRHKLGDSGGNSHAKPKGSSGRKIKFRHFTTGIRTVLGGVDTKV